MADKLTTKQLAFVHEYVKDWNGTQAAIRAGYAISGAHVAAARLLSNDKVCIELNKQRGHILQKNAITAERVLEEYRRIAFNDVTDMVHIRPGVVLIESTDDLTPEQRAAVSSIKQTDKGAIEVKFYNKQKALDSLAKHLGVFSDQNTGQHTGAGAPVIQLVFGDARTENVIEVKAENETEAENG